MITLVFMLGSVVTLAMYAAEGDRGWIVAAVACALLYTAANQSGDARPIARRSTTDENQERPTIDASAWCYVAATALAFTSIGLWLRAFHVLD